jgi:protein TonB
MSEAELPAAHGVCVSLRNDAPEVRNDGLAASETGDLAQAGLARAPSREAPEGELAPTVPSPPSRMRPSRVGDRSFIGVACSLAAHAIIVTALLVQAPWEGSSLMQDDDEISVELVDAMPETAPSPEQATSVEQAQPTPSSEPTEVDRNAAPVPPPAESEAAPLPLPVPEPTPAPAEAQPPAPPAPVPPAENEAQPQPSLPPPPETVPKELSPAEPIVPRAEPSRNVPSAADIAARERAERLEREKREEAAKAARERAARATEAEKRQEEQRQEARQQAQAKAAQDSAAKAAQDSAAKAAEDSAVKAAASAYRGLVIGHLAGFKRYPPAARARGAQGSPAVSFSIDASGHVISVSLTRASGDPDIDAEIVAMVHRASPFPAPPPGAPHVFTAGVNFRLQ